MDNEKHPHCANDFVIICLQIKRVNLIPVRYFQNFSKQMFKLQRITLLAQIHCLLLVCLVLETKKILKKW